MARRQQGRRALQRRRREAARIGRPLLRSRATRNPRCRANSARYSAAAASGSSRSTKSAPTFEFITFRHCLAMSAIIKFAGAYR